MHFNTNVNCDETELVEWVRTPQQRRIDGTKKKTVNEQTVGSVSERTLFVCMYVCMYRQQQQLVFVSLNDRTKEKKCINRSVRFRLSCSSSNVVCALGVLVAYGTTRFTLSPFADKTNLPNWWNSQKVELNSRKIVFSRAQKKNSTWNSNLINFSDLILFKFFFYVEDF